MNQRPTENSGRANPPGRLVWTALGCALIVAATLCAWSNSFRGPFIYDDLACIPDNESLRHFPSLDNLRPSQTTSPGMARRPVTNLTLAINYAIGDLGVRGYHAGNLLIHVAAALALFGVVRRTLWTAWTKVDNNGHLSTSSTTSTSSILAFAVAIIWSLHPLQTESVTYIVQRAESLAGLFYLLTLYCAIRGASSAHPWNWYSCAIAACALGMGSKEIVATAPVVVLLYDRCFLSGSFREALRRRTGLYVGLAATWLVLGALMIAYRQSEGSSAGFGLQAVKPWEYAATQPGVILHYLQLSFWPARLCLDYWWPLAKTAGEIVPAAVAVAALLAATVWALVRRPALGFLGAWFFLILAPTSSIVPILDACFEHRMYLSLAAVVAASVMAAYWIGQRCLRSAVQSDGTRRLVGWCAGLAALLAAAGALGWLTHERNKAYRTELDIWADTVAKAKENPRALNNLGCYLSKAGLPDEALRRLDKAIEIRPDYADAFNNRSIAYGRIRQWTPALSDSDEAVRLNPYSAANYVNRAKALAALGRFDKAIEDCGQALALNPHYAEAYYNRANARAQLARRDANASDQLNRYEAAIADYGKAIALAQDFAMAYENRANAYLTTRRFADAVADYSRAIELRPDVASAYHSRAVALLCLGSLDEAAADERKFLELSGRTDAAFLNDLIHQAAERRKKLQP